MKATISDNIAKILRENKYDYWVFRTSILPRELKKKGFDFGVVLKDTELKYFLNGKDVTGIINTAIENKLGKSVERKYMVDLV